jgi:hypothetical protein
MSTEFQSMDDGFCPQCLTLLLGDDGAPGDKIIKALVLEKVAQQQDAYRRIGLIYGSNYDYFHIEKERVWRRE